MTQTIKAIETQYKGYRFRSRLEARWAVFFDALNIKWEYEKEGYELGEAGWYLPDFWLPELKFFVEVKPSLTEAFQVKSEALARLKDTTVLVVTSIPEQRFDDTQDAESSFELFLYKNGDWDEDEKNLFRNTVSLSTSIDEMLSSPDFNESNRDDWEIHCPICGNQYTHLSGEPSKAKGNDNYEAGFWGRGDAIRFNMYCEDGHSWTVRFGFHKGNTYLGVENATRTTFDPGNVFSPGNPKMLAKAFAAARSARFEHGETPN